MQDATGDRKDLTGAAKRTVEMVLRGPRPSPCLQAAALPVSTQTKLGRLGWALRGQELCLLADEHSPGPPAAARGPFNREP